MNKQIEEMAKDICKLGKPCEKCSAYPDACKAMKYAERFCTAGYRKQGENTDEVRHGHWLRYGQDELQCSLCGAVNNNCINNNYCPNCGAMMKGDEGK